MTKVKINQRGNINIPQDLIRGMITFEKGKEFEVMTDGEYETLKTKEKNQRKGAIVLVPLKGLTKEDYDIPF